MVIVYIYNITVNSCSDIIAEKNVFTYISVVQSHSQPTIVVVSLHCSAAKVHV